MPVSALRVRGPFKGPTGYDHHVREFVREFHSQGVAVELIDLPLWSPAKLPADARDSWFETLDRPVGARVALHFCMPHQVVVDRRRANVNYTMFEADRIPADWVARALALDLTVVPTESSARAWIDSGVPSEKVRVCPLGINPSIFGRPVTPIPFSLRGHNGLPITRRRVRFLNVSELGLRKNVVGLLRAWILATSRHDDAALILKIGCYGRHTLQTWQAGLERLQRALGRRLDQAAEVQVVDRLLPDRDMPRLYATATHYISTSFGEGWDQPMVEAAASGLKLIAPDHTAYRTYLDRSTAQLIPSRLVPASAIGTDVEALFEHANWWEPDQSATIDCIRAAIEGRDSEVGSAQERILSDLTWAQSTRRLLAIIDDVEATRVRRGLWSLPRWSRRT
jgi:glycosyltransferase involved in cell wall biosynthesis